LDDCRLLLLEGSSSPESKARALAVLTYVDCLNADAKDTVVRQSSPDRMTALQLLLGCAAKHVTAVTKFLGEPGLTAGETSTILLCVVRLIQLVVLDAYRILIPEVVTVDVLAPLEVQGSVPSQTKSLHQLQQSFLLASPHGHRPLKRFLLSLKTCSKVPLILLTRKTSPLRIQNIK